MSSGDSRRTRAVVAISGWSLDTVVVGLAGVGIAFAMWWLYFVFPAGAALEARRDRSFVFGYAHMLIFAAVAATGAGMRVYAAYLQSEAHISEGVVVASVAVPVAIFVVTLTFIYSAMVEVDPLHVWMGALLVVVSAMAMLLAAAGLSLTLCLLLVLLTPAATVVADELTGHQRRAKALARLSTS